VVVIKEFLLVEVIAHAVDPTALFVSKFRTKKKTKIK
jgi:hypothetical protein